MSLTRESRSGTPWTPPFQATCSNGHEIHADHPVDACPLTPHGQPCTGTLQRFGPGSRTTGGR